MAPDPTTRTVDGYLAERYWPGLTPGEAAAVVERLTRSADSMRGGDGYPRLIACVFVANEQALVCVVMAVSRNEVEAIGHEAGAAFDRVSEAFVYLTRNTAVAEMAVTNP